MKVFIVDDSKILRERLVTILNEIDFVEIIGESEETEQAIQSIKNLHPDIVILDLRMPGGGGINVLQNIKNGSGSPLVIIFTNYPYEQYKKACFERGADYFLDKSTEFEKIPEIIKYLSKKFQKKNEVVSRAKK